MPDRETVITHLQIIHTWAEFARERDLQFFTAKHLEDIAQWADEALELLKEQEAKIEQLNRFVNGFSRNAMPVVRCKDCKYYDSFNGCMSWHDVNSGNENWFCADGERRADDG